VENVLAIGLVSGTSRDGIDVALIETDGESHVRPLAFQEHPYSPPVRDLIAQACTAAAKAVTKERNSDPVIEEANRIVTSLHLEAVRKLLNYTGMERHEIEVIGFAGHTVAHKPELGWTWQIGSGSMIADEIRIKVISDFREDDMKAGGQGAPLIPIFHQAIADEIAKPIAIVNLGGVANITGLYADGDMSAFDCGMANALIDDWMLKHTGEAFDRDGKMAASGTVDEEILADMLRDNFFKAFPPKSLDRDAFTTEAVAGLSVPDGAATLTAFSAEGVVRGLVQIDQRPEKLFVTGGGRKNPTLLRMISERTGMATTAIDKLGWNGDAVEAQGFAYMAVRRVRLLPVTFPTTTGASEPTLCGTINQPIERRSMDR
jgi:anhydro-N-acetylmuramic acid kinase